MVNDRKFQIKDQCVLSEDIFITVTGKGLQLYASKGEVVTVMSFDPRQEKPYGVRVARERYLNASIADTQAELGSVGTVYADLGL